VKKMKKMGVVPDSGSYHVLLEHLSVKGDLRKCSMLFEMMHQENVTPDVNCMNSLIKLYCKLDRVEDAVQLLRRMDWIQPEESSYLLLMQHALKNGFPDSCISIFRLMQHNKIKLSQASYNVVISAFFAKGQPQFVMQTMYDMMKERLCPDTNTFNKLILEFGKEENVHGARLAFDYMKKVGVYPNTRTYNTLIHIYLSLSMVDEAQELQNELMDNGFEFSVADTAYLSQFFGDQMMGSVRTMLKMITDKGLRLTNYNIINQLIRYFAQRHEKFGLELIAQMERERIPFTVDICNLLIQVLLQRGQRPSEILSFMASSEIFPNSDTYRILIHHAQNVDQKEMSWLMENMVNDKVVPNRGLIGVVADKWFHKAESLYENCFRST